MPNTIEDEVIRKLQERAARGELNGIDVTYRVTGGAPGEQLVDEEIHLSGPGPVTARLRTTAATMRESSENLAAPEMKELLLQIGEGAGELIPRSQARFVPDSIVGQISVKIDGQEASFFFLADEEQAKQFGKALSPQAARSIGSLMRLHKRILHIQEEAP
jgi:hypothetical protein